MATAMRQHVALQALIAQNEQLREENGFLTERLEKCTCGAAKIEEPPTEEKA
jgi:hypothetical protein